MLERLKIQTKDAVSDVRRLVYGLGPPALDDLGLVGAIREQAAKHGRVADDLERAAPDLDSGCKSHEGEEGKGGDEHGRRVGR